MHKQRKQDMGSNTNNRSQKRTEYRNGHHNTKNTTGQHKNLKR